MSTNFEMFEQSSYVESPASGIDESLRADADGPLVRCQSGSPGCLPTVEFDDDTPGDDSPGDEQPKKSPGDDRSPESPKSEAMKIHPWMQLLRSSDTDKPLIARLPRRTDDIRDLSIADLESLARKNATSDSDIKERSKAYQELIRQYDEKLPPKDFEKSVGRMSKIQGDGTEPRSIESYKEFGEIANKMQDQIRVRQDYAAFLKNAGKFDEAKKIARDADEKAQLLLKPVRIDKESVTPWNLIRKEFEHAMKNMSSFNSADARSELQKLCIDRYVGQDGILNRPKQTSILLSEVSLGTKIDWNKEKPDADLDQSKSFDLKQAYEAAKRARESTKQLFGYDPLEERINDHAKGQPSVKALFDLMLSAIENSEKTKQPLLGLDGKPVPAELIERIKNEKPKRTWESLGR
ncbi:MAG: hypothetical protein K2Z81_05945 [Cyanobacteria bacterium]|nr:hypothetical protein [Cyanobacteriota bacterium]